MCQPCSRSAARSAPSAGWMSRAISNRRGERRGSLGALHLGRLDTGGRWRYLGKVGTGLDDRLLGSLHDTLAAEPRSPRPFDPKPLDDAASRWVEPRLVCEVRFASLTSDGALREPVFLRLRPDLAVEDCADPPPEGG